MYAFTLKLPTGEAERRLGNKGVDVALCAVVGKTCGPVTLTWHGGYVCVSRDRPRDFWRLAGALEYRLTETWALTGEIVCTLGVNVAPDVTVLRMGAVYALTTRVKLDGAVGMGMTRASRDVLLTVGATMTLF